MRSCFLFTSLVLAVLSPAARAAELAAPPAGCQPPACVECWPCCDDCPGGASFYASAEYLLWWIKAAPVPAPLLTTSTNNDPRATLDKPTTRVLFGGRSYDYGPFSGGRVTAGWQAESGVGVEASGFLLQQRTRSFFTATNAAGFPVLATPFFDAVANRESASFYSLPTPDGGSARFLIDLSSRAWGAEANVTASPFEGGAVKVKLLTGFRYLDLGEKLWIINQAVFFAPTQIFNGPTFPAFSRFPAFDAFETRNQFYGGQVGAQAEACLGGLVLTAQAKVALGSVREVLTVNGGTQSISPTGVPATLTVPGDSFALASNIGRFARNEFAVVPEVGLTAGYRVTDAVRVTVGYNFLYVSQALRPGNTMDRRLNPSLIPTFSTASAGPALPAPQFNQTDWYAQGLTFGVGVEF